MVHRTVALHFRYVKLTGVLWPPYVHLSTNYSVVCFFLQGGGRGSNVGYGGGNPNPPNVGYSGNQPAGSSDSQIGMYVCSKVEFLAMFQMWLVVYV